VKASEASAATAGPATATLKGSLFSPAPVPAAGAAPAQTLGAEQKKFGRPPKSKVNASEAAALAAINPIIGRCRWTVKQTALKAHMVSALETMISFNCI
jgi:hypothetical protein